MLRIKSKRRAQAMGLTLIDVLLVLVVIFGLTWLWTLRKTRGPRTAGRIKCVNNLKNIGASFQVFANNNDGRFPMHLSVAKGGTKELAYDPTLIWMHYAAISNELSTPIILLCPEDKEGRKAVRDFSRMFRNARQGTFSENANISYFVGIEAAAVRPNAILSGDRNITNQGSMPFEYGTARVGPLGTNHTSRAGAGWDRHLHANTGNSVLGDGSVQQFTSSRFRDQLIHSGDTNNIVAVPD